MTSSCFFEVLLADMEYDRDSEATAVAYTRYDRLRDRNELGQVSDIEVLQAASEYRLVRRERAVSQGRQRTRRALLAEVLNRPGVLPDTLVEPVRGGTVGAAEAAHLAELHRMEARLDRRTREARQAVLERGEDIQTLRMGLVEARARIEYRSCP